jgi:hypothetical protein
LNGIKRGHRYIGHPDIITAAGDIQGVERSNSYSSSSGSSSRHNARLYRIERSNSYIGGPGSSSRHNARLYRIERSNSYSSGPGSSSRHNARLNGIQSSGGNISGVAVREAAPATMPG